MTHFTKLLRVRLLTHGDNIHSAMYQQYIVLIFSYGVEGAGILLRHCMLNNQCLHEVNVELCNLCLLINASIL